MCKLVKNKEFIRSIEEEFKEYLDKLISDSDEHGNDNTIACFPMGHFIEKKPVVSKKPGYVYLLKEKDSDGLKIGMTGCSCVESRINQIKTNSPHDIEAIGYIEVEDAKGIEADLHTMFARNNIRREWFAITPEEAIPAFEQFAPFVRL